jgi:hypothetical protein
MSKLWRYTSLTVATILLIMLFHWQGLLKIFPTEQSFGAKLNPATLPAVPTSLFNLNIINLDYGAAWPTIPFKGWRNAYSDWDLLEPNQGKWNFERLDRDVALAQQHGVEMLFILKYVPTWASVRPNETGCCTPDAQKGNTAVPKNIEDWRNYVRTIAMRYKGRVRYYELWNEPNVKRFYSGTVKQLVALNRAAYQVLKEVDPTITVISSAMSAPESNALRYFEDYLALGGGRYTDVISFHFYVTPKPPEAMLPIIQRVQGLLAKYKQDHKQLWNTETGWKTINRDKNIDDEEWAGKALSLGDASAYIARSYILSWARGVERLYWYAWGHRSMGLTEYDIKTPKPVATAYTEVRNWLLGSKITSCEPDRNKTWVCQLKRDRGNLAWIVWNPERRQLFNVPQKWNVRQIRDLSGKKHTYIRKRRIVINPSPQLLEGLTS